jgi:hypothetical protein
MPNSMKCRSCKSREVRRSSRRNAVERLLSAFGLLPYRCLDCNRRFFGMARSGA